ncbi:MAG: AraC family transcriptional regulator [Pseudoramibacter sp.]|jgi:AraC-like DNA-binding protein
MQVTNIPLDPAGRETTQQGPTSFPMAVYHSVMSRNVFGYTPLHWHEEIQYCLMTRGSVDFTVNEKNFRLENGDGIFINSGFLHMAKPVSDLHSTYICLDINPRLLAGFPGSLMEQKYVMNLLEDPSLSYFPLSKNNDRNTAALQAIKTIYNLSEDASEGKELLILSELYRLLFETLKKRKKNKTPASGKKANVLVQKILAYMAAHYSEKILLCDIAEATAYSESECCRIFKRFTGESIFSYLKTFRLEQSTYLLSNSEDNIADIAYHCGFSSTSYFIKMFREQFGTTPHKYRKQLFVTEKNHLF